MEINIDVQDMRKIDMPRGATKGFASVRIDFGPGNGYMTIEGLGIVKPLNKPTFVSPPQRSYVSNRDGSTKYQNLVGFYGPLRDAVNKKILDEWSAAGYDQEEESPFDDTDPFGSDAPPPTDDDVPF